VPAAADDGQVGSFDARGRSPRLAWHRQNSRAHSTNWARGNSPSLRALYKGHSQRTVQYAPFNQSSRGTVTGRYELPAIAFGPKLEGKLIGNVPVKNDVAIPLIFPPSANRRSGKGILDHRNRVPGCICRSSGSPRSRKTIVAQRLIESHIVHKECRARRPLIPHIRSPSP